MEELAPGVFAGPRLPGANCYLIREGEVTVLVDAGMPGDHRRLAGWLESEAIRLDVVLLTHGDVDHRGRAGELARMHGAEVWAAEGERPFLTGGLRPRRLLRRVMVHLIRPVPVDRWLTANDQVAGFTVWETPGHTLGHISLVRQEDRVVLAGDALVVGRQGPTLAARWVNEDQAAAAESGQRLCQIQPTLLLTGHGPPWRPEAGA